MNPCRCGNPNPTPMKRLPDYHCVFCVECGAATKWQNSAELAALAWYDLMRIKTREKKILDTERPKIVEYYTKYHTPVIELAKAYGVTRLAIYKVLRSRKVKTGSYGKLTVRCGYCNAKIEKYRSQIKRNGKNFCDSSHAAKYMNKGGIKSIRNKIRLAKKMLRDVRPVSCGEFVTWTGKLELANLEIYKSKVSMLQGEEPVWRGIDLTKEFL